MTLPEVIDFRQMLTVRQTIRMESELARKRGDVLSLAAMTAIIGE